MKKCRQTNYDINFVLLQIRLPLIGTDIPSPVMLLLNRPIRALLPQTGRELINVNKFEEYYKALKSWQDTYFKNNDAHKDSPFSAGSTVAVHREDMGPCKQQ